MTASTPGPIVPRWEWRAFGERVGVAAGRLAELPERVEESDELYLLSRRSDASVKVRDALMDVKELRQVDADGLEQWLPVMKSGFPLVASDVAAVLAALGVRVPPLARDAYTLDELVGELVGPNPDLQAIEVHKRREHQTLGGCMTELTEIGAAAGTTRTIAVESEDAASVLATVRGLGFESRPNVSVARGLKALTGLGTRSYAVIDVGTTSVKFHIGERRADGEWLTIVDRAEVTRLGEGLAESGRLNDAPLERTVDAVAAMVDEAREHDAVAIVAVGTAGLRIARNRAEFVDAVQGRCGVRVEIIPGEEEARLAYLGVTSGLDLGSASLVVFDTGGGSSQFTFGHGERVNERFSVDVGAARFTERFGLDGPVPDDILAEALEAMADDLRRLDGRPTPDALVGIGGAVTNLAAVKHELAAYDPDVVRGTVLERAEIERQIELYRGRTAEERRAIVGLQPKRAEVILAGACIVHTVLGKLGCDSLTVSDRGLRHGLLAERFGADDPRMP